MSVPPPSDGQLLGHYRLLEKVGGGGQGHVYRAWDEQLERNVALKIIPPERLEDEAARETFRNTAKALARLSDPHVALAYDFGHQDGIDYLVTEYVEGMGLDEVLARGPVAQPKLLEWGMQLAQGLEAVHKQHIVHRDLKPSNVRLTPSDQLKIIDFGLATRVDPIGEAPPTVTIGTPVIFQGTLPYMAPEQLTDGFADPRSDLWAAGTILYEMATGQRAFSGNQPSALRSAILNEDPPPPSSVNPNVSAPLEKVISRALVKNPDKRYQTARALYLDLQRVRHGDDPTEDFGRIRQIPVRQAIALAALMLLVVVAGWLIYRAWWTPPQKKFVAVLPFETAGDDPAAAALGRGLMENVSSRLAQASDEKKIQVISPRDIRERSVKTAADARREFGADLALECSMRQAGQQVRINCGLVNCRTHASQAAVTITGSSADAFALEDSAVQQVINILPGGGTPKVVEAKDRSSEQPAAYEYYVRGRGYLQEYQKPENIDSAIAEFDHAIQINPNFAAAYAGLGEAYWKGYEQNNQDRAWVSKALQNCQKALSLSAQSAEAETCLGNVYDGTGKSDDAIRHFTRALALDPKSDDALRGLASAYQRSGNYAAAEETYRKAIALRPDYWALYDWLGYFYWDRGQYAKATEMFQKVTEIAPDNSRGWSNLGALYIDQGEYANAIEAEKHSISLSPNLDAYGNLGYTYFLMHRFAESADAVRESIKLDNQYWMTWGNLADALYWTPDQRSQATETYRKAISLAKSRLEVNPKDALVLAYLADYSAMVDDRQSAFRYLNDALSAGAPNPEILFRAALVHNHFGDTSQTLTFLRKALDAGYSPTIVRDTPDFGPLQQNPQFKALLAARK